MMIDAKSYNKAIDDAVKSYAQGIGAIKALRLYEPVVVDNITYRNECSEIDMVKEAT